MVAARPPRAQDIDRAAQAPEQLDDLRLDVLLELPRPPGR